MPPSRRLETGALKELVYSAKLWIKENSAGSKEAQTRDIECVINELADATLAIPANLRLNEVVPMTFTPHLKLYEKRADGGRGAEILGSSVEESVTLRLGQEV